MADKGNFISHKLFLDVSNSNYLIIILCVIIISNCTHSYCSQYVFAQQCIVTQLYFMHFNVFMVGYSDLCSYCHLENTYCRKAGGVFVFFPVSQALYLMPKYNSYNLLFKSETDPNIYLNYIAFYMLFKNLRCSVKVLRYYGLQ